MLSLNVPLMLILMDRTTNHYWDDEGFREVAHGYTFRQVQNNLRKIDTAAGLCDA